MDVIFLIQAPGYFELNQEKKKLMNLLYSHWIQNDLYSFNWWFLLFATIVPYFLWWKFVKRDRFFEIFCYGLLCSSISMILDVIGTETMLWEYPDMLFPCIPLLVPADFVVIPITGMIVYQYCNSWISFLLANICWAVFFSYIIEPLFVKLRLFELGLHWSHTYSFFGFFLLGLCLKLIMESIKKNLLQSNTKTKC
ncbi:CBO0543 family protein [Niallia sp. 03133]|uniref:CBO0543 family protein n=1 Tax=Niallia sp. 03133 TaxID=3458060 RepID=UPI004044404B